MDFNFIFQSAKSPIPESFTSQTNLFRLPAFVTSPLQQIFLKLCPDKNNRTTSVPEIAKYVEAETRIKRQVIQLVLKRVLRMDEPVIFDRFKLAMQCMAVVQTGSVSPDDRNLQSYAMQSRHNLIIGDQVYELSQEQIIEYETRSFFCKTLGQLENQVLAAEQKGAFKAVAELVTENNVKGSTLVNMEQIVVILHLLKKSRLHQIPKELPVSLKQYLLRSKSQEQKKPILRKEPETTHKSQSAVDPIKIDNFAEVFKMEPELSNLKAIELQKQLSNMKLEIIRMKNQHDIVRQELKEENTKLSQTATQFREICQELMNENKMLSTELALNAKDMKKTISEIRSLFGEVKTQQASIRQNNLRVQEDMRVNHELLNAQLETLQAHLRDLNQRQRQIIQSRPLPVVVPNNIQLPQEKSSTPKQDQVPEPKIDIDYGATDDRHEDMFAAHENFLKQQEKPQNPPSDFFTEAVNKNDGAHKTSADWEAFASFSTGETQQKLTQMNFDWTG